MRRARLLVPPVASSLPSSPSSGFDASPGFDRGGTPGVDRPADEADFDALERAGVPPLTAIAPGSTLSPLPRGGAPQSCAVFLLSSAPRTADVCLACDPTCSFAARSIAFRPGVFPIPSPGPLRLPPAVRRPSPSCAPDPLLCSGMARARACAGSPRPAPDSRPGRGALRTAAAPSGGETCFASRAAYPSLPDNVGTRVDDGGDTADERTHVASRFGYFLDCFSPSDSYHVLEEKSAALRRKIDVADPSQGALVDHRDHTPPKARLR